MTDLKENLELLLNLGSSVECEMPRHKVDGVLGRNHDEGGVMWQVHTYRPCCPRYHKMLVCNKVHSLMLTWLDEPRLTGPCLQCGKKWTFREMYVRSVKWG